MGYFFTIGVGGASLASTGAFLGEERAELSRVSRQRGAVLWACLGHLLGIAAVLLIGVTSIPHVGLVATVSAEFG